MGAGHGHHHHGRGRREASTRGLKLALALVAAYMVAEVVGGLLSGSLALLADAGHMLSDAGALALALFAMHMARKPATAKRTFGLHRGEILAALANGAVLAALSVWVAVEAFERLSAPPQVEAPLMLAIACGGLLVNLAGLWILREGRSESLNVRGAWLHVLGDALGSAGAILSGALIWAFGWQWADPVASLLIAVLVVISAWNLIKEATAVLMESAPGHIDVDEVRDAMVRARHVVDVHDLHVWTITSGLESLSAHVVVSAGDQARAVLQDLRRSLHERFGIDHVTLQIETEGRDDDCPECP